MTLARARLDSLTKPPGSLGRLEEIAIQLAGITGRPLVRLGERIVIVMAGDHGVVAEGVSAYPSEVTAQMLLEFRPRRGGRKCPGAPGRGAHRRGRSGLRLRGVRSKHREQEDTARHREYRARSGDDAPGGNRRPRGGDRDRHPADCRLFSGRRAYPGPRRDGNRQYDVRERHSRGHRRFSRPNGSWGPAQASPPSASSTRRRSSRERSRSTGRIPTTAWTSSPRWAGSRSAAWPVPSLPRPRRVYRRPRRFHLGRRGVDCGQDRPGMPRLP